MGSPWRSSRITQAAIVVRQLAGLDVQLGHLRHVYCGHVRVSPSAGLVHLAGGEVTGRRPLPYRGGDAPPSPALAAAAALALLAPAARAARVSVASEIEEEGELVTFSLVAAPRRGQPRSR